MSYRYVISIILTLVIMPSFGGDLPLKRHEPEQCKSCINLKYEIPYACEGNWDCKWNMTGMRYGKCLESSNEKCIELAIEKLKSVMTYAGPPRIDGKETYRETYLAVARHFSCDIETIEFYHESALVFGYICDNEFFDKAIETIAKGCPNKAESKAVINAISKGYDTYLMNSSSDKFKASTTVSWNEARAKCL
ncbi:MAG: hypothetical protein V7731_18840 [Amphritea sp.]